MVKGEKSLLAVGIYISGSLFKKLAFEQNGFKMGSEQWLKMRMWMKIMLHSRVIWHYVHDYAMFSDYWPIALNGAVIVIKCVTVVVITEQKYKNCRALVHNAAQCMWWHVCAAAFSILICLLLLCFYTFSYYYISVIYCKALWFWL